MCASFEVKYLSPLAKLFKLPADLYRGSPCCAPAVRPALPRGEGASQRWSLAVQVRSEVPRVAPLMVWKSSRREECFIFLVRNAESKQKAPPNKKGDSQKCCSLELCSALTTILRTSRLASSVACARQTTMDPLSTFWYRFFLEGEREMQMLCSCISSCL